MKVFKIIGIVLLVTIFVICLLCTIYFLFAQGGYGIDIFRQTFKNGVFVGIKTFFSDIWKGLKFVFTK